MSKRDERPNWTKFWLEMVTIAAAATTVWMLQERVEDITRRIEALEAGK